MPSTAPSVMPVVAPFMTATSIPTLSPAEITKIPSHRPKTITTAAPSWSSEPTQSIQPTISHYPTLNSTISIEPTVSQYPTYTTLSPTISMEPTISLYPILSIEPTISLAPSISHEPTVEPSPAQTYSREPATFSVNSTAMLSTSLSLETSVEASVETSATPLLVPLLVKSSIPKQVEVTSPPMKKVSITALIRKNRLMKLTLEQWYFQSNLRVITITLLFSIVALAFLVLWWTRTTVDKTAFERESELVQFERGQLIPKVNYINAREDDYLRLSYSRQNNMKSATIKTSSVDISFTLDDTINILYASADSSDENFNIC